jgi:xanthine dehydrogenase accessory factor
VKELLEAIREWRHRGEGVAIATVVACRRSAPRPVGSKLAVSGKGELLGSVSGGCVESDVRRNALEVLRSGKPRLLTYGIADDLALTVGLPCGGEIDIFVERLHEETFEALSNAVLTEARAVLFTVLAGPDVGTKLLVTADGALVGDAPRRLAELAASLLGGHHRLIQSEEILAFAEVFGPPPRLVVFGALDTSEALCRTAKALGWRTIVVEARKALAASDRVPSADEIVISWPQEALAQIRPGSDTAIVALTHDEKFDIPAILGALRSEAFYIGALGSRRAQEERRARLREAGVTEPELARVYGPCGLDIGGETPVETAVSILAEILAVRAGRRGGHLRESPERIHRAADDGSNVPRCAAAVD